MMPQPTIPSEQNGNFTGSIQMKRVPCSFLFLVTISMFAVVMTLSMGFKSMYTRVCVFISVKKYSHLDFDCMIQFAKNTANLISQSSYLLQSCNVHPHVKCATSFVFVVYSSFQVYVQHNIYACCLLCVW